MKLTQEQANIIEAATTTSDNLAIIARAGAAKTTTLVLIAEAVAERNILCLAFNKKIAEEMATRLPKHCQSKTLHSLGYAAWASFITPRIKLDKGKQTRILKEHIEAAHTDDAEIFRERYSDIVDTLNQAKADGYLPSEYSGHWKPLVKTDEWFETLPIEHTLAEVNLIKAVLKQSYQESLHGTIDFNDMIYCPAITSVSWPTFKLVLIDEAQDLSPLDQHILSKVVRKNRLIAVGDPFQAIYGFRGAMTDSLDQLSAKFNLTPYHLTTTFRCAPAIVAEAQWRAPDLNSFWPDRVGTVSHLGHWNASTIPDGAVIICRNNAPLFRTAVRLLGEGRLPEYEGRDILGPLTKILKSLGKPSDVREKLLRNLDRWTEKELKRARPGAAGKIHDNAECIRIILTRTETMSQAQGYLDKILTQPGRIKLMTGHKSKGREFRHVFFLDRQICNPEYEQDMNLAYVIITRAEYELTYITSKGWEAADEITE